MKKVLFAFLLLIICISVKAYTNTFFTVNLPKDYKQTVNEKYTFKWTKNNNYFAATISNNKELKYNIVNFDEKDFENQKKYLEDSYNEGLSKYNITATVSNIRKVQKDDIAFLEYDIFYPSKKATGYDTYQKGRMYTTTKYITNIVFNSDSEIKEDNKEYKEIMDSFKIFDEIIVVKNEAYIDYIIGGIALLIIIVIAYAIISFKKRK